MPFFPEQNGTKQLTDLLTRIGATDTYFHYAISQVLSILKYSYHAHTNSLGLRLQGIRFHA
jgi:hypothetical protein